MQDNASAGGNQMETWTIITLPITATNLRICYVILCSMYMDMQAVFLSKECNRWETTHINTNTSVSLSTCKKAWIIDKN